MRGCTGNGDAAWPIRQVHPHRLTGRYGFSKDGVGDIKRSERLGGLADRGRKTESALETAGPGCARTGWCQARRERKSVVKGKRVACTWDHGGRRSIKK